MRIVLRLLLLLLLGAAQLWGAPPRRPASGAPTQARTSIDLLRWGTAHGFTGLLLPRGDEFQLTNRSVKMVFKANSRRFSYGGTEIRLSYPVTRTGDRFFLHLTDLDTVLTPLHTPPKRAANRPIRLIALNAGHGGKDPGNLEGRHQEKLYTALLAGEVRRALERAGLRVIQIRHGDTFVELEERAGQAIRAKADLYVSLHFNAFDGPNAAGVSGVETYCLTPAGASSSNDTGNHGGSAQPGNRFDRDNIVLTHEVHRAIVAGTDLPDRSVRRARFKELALLEMPGLLVEGGYMTNADDIRTIYTATGRSQLARAIVDGVLAYKRLVERGGGE
jgi:N-acetylmuramoyl-L-alanine amidase